MASIFNYFNKDYINDESKFNLSESEKELCYQLQFRSINKLNIKENAKFDNLERRLADIIDDRNFLRKSLLLIELIRNYGAYRWNDDGLICTFMSNNEYKFRLKISDNSVSLNLKDPKDITVSSYKNLRNKYLIRNLNIRRSSVYYLEDDRDYIDTIVFDNLGIYDMDGKELHFKSTEEHKNYYKNADGSIELVPTTDRENSIETRKYYRYKNKVLMQHKLVFLNKNHEYSNGTFIFDKNTINKDDYYIAENFNPNASTLPKMLFFERLEYGNFMRLKKECAKLRKKVK